MRSPKLVSSLILTTLAFTGCELSDNAKRSADNSQRAADNSEKMVDLSHNAYGDGRQSGARDRREKALETMARAVSLEAKLAAAAAYYSALEYQVWKDDGFREDDEAKRVRLITEGVSELMKVQKDYPKPNMETTYVADAENGGVKPAGLAEAMGNENVRNAFAIAGAMQKLSERQIEASKRYGFKTKSMVEILGEALAASKSAGADPRVLAEQPAYVYEALRETADVAALFEMRVNLFAGTALKALAVPFSVDADGKLQVTATAVQLQDASDRLKLALQSVQILGTAGIRARIFADVKGGRAQLLAGMGKIPATSIQSAKSANLPKLLEVKALLEKLPVD